MLYPMDGRSFTVSRMRLNTIFGRFSSQNEWKKEIAAFEARRKTYGSNSQHSNIQQQ